DARNWKAATQEDGRLPRRKHVRFMHYVINIKQDGEVRGRKGRFEGNACEGSASDWLLLAPALGIDACFHSDYKHTCVRYTFVTEA
ncbi:uncharacterized, partial [Tachysurus ichikawai]